MTGGAAWFLIWIPKQEEERRKISEAQLQVENEKIEKDRIERQKVETTKQILESFPPIPTNASENDWPDVASIAREEDKTTFDESGSAEADATGSSASVRIIEVKEVQNESTEISSTGVEDNSQPTKTSTTNSVKDFESIENEKKVDVEDVFTMEEIVNRELTNLAVSGLCWQISRDKKNTLCMFFVRSGFKHTNIENIIFLFQREGEAETLLNSLRSFGIGHDFNSTVR